MAESRPELRALRILVIDDEEHIRFALTMCLETDGHKVTAAGTIEAALEETARQAFDLIFLDADMPVMNGFELCAQLRKMAPHKTTPVIFVTGLTNFEVRAQSSLAGANDLIAKPFLMMELAVKALTYLLRPK